VLSLILPTVALNGPLWGQCDAIYTGAILFGVAAALENRSLAMLTAFGVAFSFKLQAVFLAPFLLYQVLRQRPPAWLLLVPPAVFAGLMLPAWFSGRPAMELLTLYLHQANLNPALSVNAPNPWLAARKLGLSYEVGAPIGVGLAAVACLALALTAHRARLDRSGSLLLALGSAVILPYLLPNMHDRYFFVADVLSLVLAYAAPGPRTIAAAVLIQAGSLGAYLNYLFDVSGGAMAGMLLMSAGVAVVVHQIAGAFTVAPAVQYRPGRG
jgi:Gpi18-like mannosyltransferase